MVLIDRRADRDQASDAIVGHADLHTCSSSERKACKRDVLLGIFLHEPAEGIADILDAALYLGMNACRCSDAAKIEAKRCQPGVNEARSSTEDNLIVHRSAAERVRMTDKTNAARLSLWLLEDRLEPPMRGRNQQVSLRIHP